MTERAIRIRDAAAKLYAKKNPRVDWNDWMWNEHVVKVAEFAEKIAMREQCDTEACIIAAYLHDIAFAWMRKDDSECDEQSLRKAREILKQEKFANAEIDRIVRDIIEPHGAHEGAPKTVEGKVLSTADAMAHLTADFYRSRAINRYLFEDKTSDEYRSWVLQKIERDFHRKIQFAHERAIAEPHYMALKALFSKI